MAAATGLTCPQRGLGVGPGRWMSDRPDAQSSKSLASWQLWMWTTASPANTRIQQTTPRSSAVMGSSTGCGGTGVRPYSPTTRRLCQRLGCGLGFCRRGDVGSRLVLTCLQDLTQLLIFIRFLGADWQGDGWIAQ
jgi:hypothetical protein